MSQPPNYTELISRSLEGDRKAVEALIISIQKKIYNLSVRYFWNPMEAEDATQEILIKIITNLSEFRGESAFPTWAYRVATNYLLNAKRTEAEYLTFEVGKHHLDTGMTYPAYEYADRDLLANEVKIACSTSMLLCLSPELRLAYLIGQILEFDSNEAGYILDIDSVTFRKRLSFARQKIKAFMGMQCGLYNSENPCRCAGQITYNLHIGRFSPDLLNFADKGDIDRTLHEVEAILNEVAIFNSHPNYTPLSQL